MSFSIQKIDHVQLAMPRGEEEIARKFYEQILGFQEVEKPELLKKRGGVWFAQGTVKLHLGVEDPFTPAKKAHPAFTVENIETMKQHLNNQGIEYLTDDNLPGANRIHVHDVFGNRLEFLEWES